MKKEVILVPKEKCPLDVLAEMGDAVSNAWIFLHENAFEKLWKSADSHRRDNTMNGPEEATLKWKKTEKYPETNLICEVPKCTWAKIQMIKAVDIAYDICPNDPADIYFLKME